MNKTCGAKKGIRRRTKSVRFDLAEDCEALEKAASAIYERDLLF